MVLSDRDIRAELERKRIIVEPLGEGCVQPASVDLRLGHKLRIFKQHSQGFIDVKQESPHLTELVEVDEDTPFYLHPGEFALGVTLERIVLPPDIVGRLDGKSSLGRLGLVVHSTAGFVDPGWDGYLTLELSNLSPLPITLYHRMKVSQISFMRLTSPAELPYGSKQIGSKYQGQDEPVPSRYYLNYRPKR
ncbi:MAG: dCTP deaminase [Dehalococcoidia bacterium]|nr:dCTP deaminase [Dehalococcoidia bacterium]